MKFKLDTLDKDNEKFAPKFVVQEHNALKAGLHYDLRLQVGTVLFSWAVPKGIPKKPEVKRLAIRTEDHSMSWISFEGVIPKGEYGAGIVKVYDSGVYIPLEVTNKKLIFKLKGKKFKGIWMLELMYETKWLLSRMKEEN
jgi:bifunctional non-homologous end joining protein LigD